MSVIAQWEIDLTSQRDNARIPCLLSVFHRRSNGYLRTLRLFKKLHNLTCDTVEYTGVFLLFCDVYYLDCSSVSTSVRSVSDPRNRRKGVFIGTVTLFVVASLGKCIRYVVFFNNDCDMFCQGLMRRYKERFPFFCCRCFTDVVFFVLRV